MNITDDEFVECGWYQLAPPAQHEKQNKNWNEHIVSLQKQAFSWGMGINREGLQLQQQQQNCFLPWKCVVAIIKPTRSRVFDIYLYDIEIYRIVDRYKSINDIQLGYIKRWISGRRNRRTNITKNQVLRVRSSSGDVMKLPGLQAGR